jgi:hypothetical protein
MNLFRFGSTFLLSLLLAGAIPLPSDAQSGPAVISYTLVSSARVTLTVSSFTYRAHVINPLPAPLTRVQATVSSRSTATQIVDGNVEFGDVAAGATAASADTFTIRHDRRVPFNPANLTWSVGSVLGSAPLALAHDAFVTIPAVPADPRDIVDDVILTKLDLFIRSDATVAQVNSALDQTGARIVSMTKGGGAVTVGIPRQAGFSELQAFADQLMMLPGIALASPGLQSVPNLLHASNDVTAARHLVPARFPAAWNASTLLSNCQRVPLVIQDLFHSKPAGFDALFPAFPGAGLAAPTGDPREDEHGYHMAAVAAAPLGLSASPGTNPFTNCLDVRPIQKNGTTLREELQQLGDAVPTTGKSVVSYSMSLPAACRDRNATGQQVLVPCTPDLVANNILRPLNRAYLALEWKKLTSTKWPNFLIANSASNERDGGLSGVDQYPGLGRAANVSAMAVAAKADPLFGFAVDHSQWTPAEAFLDQGFSSLVASDVQINQLRADVQAAQQETTVADNVVIVGGLTTLSADPRLVSPGDDTLDEASFSNSLPDVKAVAENVAGVCQTSPCATGTGNSRAAPQVAGLAAYMLALSSDLRQQPASMTRRAIIANARGNAQTTGVLDAYAAVLSLDPVSTPDSNSWHVRRSILDVNTGGASAGRFDENDVAEFLSVLLAVDASGNPVDPNAADFSRYDLNGDGFTGGAFPERFDLDRIGSTRFGASVYQQLNKTIEGVVRTFDEDAVTDLEILCFYAYSPLYQGDSEQRRQLLSNLPATQECAVAAFPEVFFPNISLEVEDVTPPFSSVTCRLIGSVDAGSPRFPISGSRQCPRSSVQVSATRTAADTIVITGTGSVSAPVVGSVSTASASVGLSVDGSSQPPNTSRLTVSVQLNPGWIAGNSGSGPPAPSCLLRIESSGPAGTSYSVRTHEAPVITRLSETFDLAGFMTVGFIVQCNGSGGAAQASGSGTIATLTFGWN